MATTIDIPCPKCGYYVTCGYRSGWFHDSVYLMFARRISFCLECRCGFRKIYWFVSPSKLAKMYAPTKSD